MCAIHFLRISAANIGPNPFNQNRTVVANVNPAGHEILDVTQRQRISHVHHHDRADDPSELWKYRNGSLRSLPQSEAPRAFGLTELCYGKAKPGF
jgi:hypothetical protein